MKYFSQLIFLLLLSLILNSCLKAKCDGNCVSTKFIGRIYDATTNKGFPNIKVRAIWSTQSQDYIYPKVGEVRTNSNGWFEIKAKINPDNFNDESLHIQFESPAGYELRNNLDGNHFYSSENFYDYDASAFQKIDFRLYPVIEATIKLIRSQPDSIKIFHMEYSFNNEYPGYFGDLFNNFSLNHEYKILTTADLYTKVTLFKTLKSGSTIITYDSAIFRKNQTNVLQVFY